MFGFRSLPPFRFHNPGYPKCIDYRFQFIDEGSCSDYLPLSSCGFSDVENNILKKTRCKLVSKYSHRAAPYRSLIIRIQWSDTDIGTELKMMT